MTPLHDALVMAPHLAIVRAAAPALVGRNPYDRLGDLGLLLAVPFNLQRACREAIAPAAPESP